MEKDDSNQFSTMQWSFQKSTVSNGFFWTGLVDYPETFVKLQIFITIQFWTRLEILPCTWVRQAKLLLLDPTTGLICSKQQHAGLRGPRAVGQVANRPRRQGSGTGCL